jgi:sugar phosphate isomerase/epimerase
MQLQTGLNPYGLTYYLGLQGQGTPRANPDGRGLEGFIELAEELGSKTIEIFEPWIAALDDDAVAALKRRLEDLGMTPVVSSGLNHGPLDGAFRSAGRLGARLIRVCLTPVLCGDRNAAGERWHEWVRAAHAALAEYAPRAVAEGRTLVIENHQDFTSDELVGLCEEAGGGVGICYDTGNTLPVAEAPLDFTRRIAPWVRHVHLKDYNVQFTDEGFRLVRCAIGDGVVPFQDVLAILAEHHERLTAVLEPGALDVRHVRLLTQDWWNGYPPRSARSLAACLEAARRNRLADAADYRTPWERGEDGALVQYELDMIRRSVANMKAIGVMA